jgi:predicted lipid-binding transport protein (Tim44 family)
MFNDGPGMGFGPFAHILMTILSGVAFLVSFAIVAGLLFLLVRFLLVATQAAQIYVAKNRPATPVAPTTTAPAATAPASTKPATVAPAKPTTAPAPVKPATAPRTPKTPPAV